MNPNPMIPGVDIELELGGEFVSLRLKLTHYANKKIAQAQARLGIDEEDDDAPFRRVDYLGEIILNSIFPPRKDLTVDDILLALHPGNNDYVNGKIQELLQSAGLQTGKFQAATESDDIAPLTPPGTDSKPSPESTSDGVAKISGSQLLVS